MGIVTLQCNTQNCKIQVILFTELYTEQFGPDTVGKLCPLTELPGQLQVTGGDVTKLIYANIVKIFLRGLLMQDPLYVNYFLFPNQPSFMLVSLITHLPSTNW